MAAQINERQLKENQYVFVFWVISFHLNRLSSSWLYGGWSYPTYPTWLHPGQVASAPDLCREALWSPQLALTLVLVHYMLITVWSCPGVFHAMPGNVNALLWSVFFGGLRGLFPFLCTLPLLHSDSFNNLPSGIC